MKQTKSYKDRNRYIRSMMLIMIFMVSMPFTAFAAGPKASDLLVPVKANASSELAIPMLMAARNAADYTNTTNPTTGRYISSGDNKLGRWQSGSLNNGFSRDMTPILTLEYGSPRVIRAIEINFAGAVGFPADFNVRDFKVQYSLFEDNEESYVTLDTVTGNTASTYFKDLSSAPITAKFLRIVITDSSSSKNIDGSDVEQQLDSAIVMDMRAFKYSTPITSVSATPGTYDRGEKISFKVLSMEKLVVTGKPVLPITVGTQALQAEFVSNDPNASGAGSVLTFEYKVKILDKDSDGVTIEKALVCPPGASIKYEASNEEILLFMPGLSLNPGVLVDAPLKPGKLVVNDVTVNENAGSVDVVITREEGSDGTVNFDYATEDDTAKAGMDYSASSGSVTLAEGVTRKTINIPITNNNEIGTDKTFFVNLTNITGATAKDTQGVVTVQNDDVSYGSFEFTQSTYYTIENFGTATLEIVRSGSVAGDVVINYATTDATAKEDIDYKSAIGTIEFKAGESKKSILIDVINDETAEKNKIFSVALSLADPAKGTLGTKASAMVEIINDDQVSPLQVNNTTMGTAYVNERYAYDTGLRGGMQPYELSIENGRLPNGLSIDQNAVITGIPTEEGNFDFDLIIKDDQTPASILIKRYHLEVEKKSAGEFFIDDMTVNESDGVVHFVVIRMNSSSGSVSMKYRLADKTAKAGHDYTAPTDAVDLVFADGETQKTIDIPIIDDQDEESLEDFVIIFSDLTEGTMTKSEAKITIQSDDYYTPLDFNTDLLPATITVGETINVGFSITGGKAPYDVTLESGQLPPGVTYSETGLTGTPTQAGTYQFTVKVNDSQNPYATVSKDFTIHVEPIQAGEFSFATASVNVNENTGMVQLTINRTKGSQGDAVLVYNTVDGTATAMNDFGPLNSTISFADGESSKTIDLMIVDDTHVEDNEYFDVILSDVLPTEASIGANGTCRITIQNDDVAPKFMISSGPMPDGKQGSSYIYTITASGGTAPYTFSVENGSIPEGMVFKNGNIAGRPAVAGTYEFNLVAKDATGAFARERVTLKIVAIQYGEFRVDDVTANESSGNAVMHITRSNGSEGSVVVEYTTIPSTNATINSDYKPVDGFVEFLDGEIEKTIEIQLMDDTEVESDEVIGFRINVPAGITCTKALAYVTIKSDDVQQLPLSFVAERNLRWIVGQSVDMDLLQEKGNGTVQVVIQSGVLPEGLTLTSTGHLSGTVTEAGGADAILVASDTGTPVATATGAFSFIVVANGLESISVSNDSILNLDLEVGQTLEPAGVKLVGRYADGSEKELVYSNFASENLEIVLWHTMTDTSKPVTTQLALDCDYLVVRIKSPVGTLDLGSIRVRSYHTVQFMNGDGSVLDTIKVEDGHEATTSKVPSKPGFNFSGWATSTAVVHQDMTVQPVFTEIPPVTIESVTLEQGIKLSYTEGERFDASPIRIQVVYSDTTTRSAIAADFSALGLVVDKQDGSVVTLTENGKDITILLNGVAKCTLGKLIVVPNATTINGWLNDDLSRVTLNYASGDSPSSITGNFTISTDIRHGSVATVTSSDANVVSNTGVVTRPSAGSVDKDVVLTVTLTANGSSVSKPFNLKVKAIQNSGNNNSGSNNSGSNNSGSNNSGSNNSGSNNSGSNNSGSNNSGSGTGTGTGGTGGTEIINNEKAPEGGILPNTDEKKDIPQPRKPLKILAMEDLLKAKRALLPGQIRGKREAGATYRFALGKTNGNELDKLLRKEKGFDPNGMIVAELKFNTSTDARQLIFELDADFLKALEESGVDALFINAPNGKMMLDQNVLANLFKNKRKAVLRIGIRTTSQLKAIDRKMIGNGVALFCAFDEVKGLKYNGKIQATFRVNHLRGFEKLNYFIEGTGGKITLIKKPLIDKKTGLLKLDVELK